MSSRELMLRVAKLSFEDRMNKEKVAAELGIDPRKIRALIEDTGKWLLQQQARLAELEREETVEEALAEQLCAKFELAGARVVSGGEHQTPADYPRLMKRYGVAAAELFDELADFAEEQDIKLHVAISGGQTILDMMSSLTDRKRAHVHFYAAAMIGRGQTNPVSHVGPETTSTIGWARSGRFPGHLHYATVPPYDLIPEEMQGMKKQPRHDYARKQIQHEVQVVAAIEPIKRMLADMAENVNMAIAGLGLVHPAGDGGEYPAMHVERISMTGILKPLGIDPGLLAEEGAVGDLSYNLFDKSGQSKKQWRFFLTPGEEAAAGVNFYKTLVEKERLVMVIAGSAKESVIRCALAAKMFNMLVTDAHTAQRLLAS